MAGIKNGLKLLLKTGGMNLDELFCELMENSVLPSGYMIGCIDTDELEFRSSEQKDQLTVVARTPASFGFTFGARMSSIIRKAKAERLSPGTSSIAMHLTLALEQNEAVSKTQSDWYWLPMAKPFCPQLPRARKYNSFQILVEECHFMGYADEIGHSSPFVDAYNMIPEKEIAFQVGLDISKNWFGPDEILFFVVDED